MHLEIKQQRRSLTELSESSGPLFLAKLGGAKRFEVGTPATWINVQRWFDDQFPAASEGDQ